MSKNELQSSGEPRSGGKAFVRRLCEWRGVNSISMDKNKIRQHEKCQVRRKKIKNRIRE